MLEVAIIGAGPHALTLVSALLSYERSPEGFSDDDLVHMSYLARKWGLNSGADGLVHKQLVAEDLAVFDPSGEWLSSWNHNFDAFNISFLRSPLSDHCDVSNEGALAWLAQCNGWDASTSLIEQGLRQSRRRSHRRDFGPEEHLALNRPSAACFKEFHCDLIQRLGADNILKPYAITDVTWLKDGNHFQLTTSDGMMIPARRVVYAGGSHVPRIPSVFRAYTGSSLIMHSEELPYMANAWQSLVDVSTKGSQHAIVIVGGGLTAAHAALSLAREFQRKQEELQTTKSRRSNKKRPTKGKHSSRTKCQPSSVRGSYSGSAAQGFQQQQQQQPK
eukprot:m.40512 g.40512  ORF g.40512 m.40512 type:complete len:332 (+) comp11727_c0_seq1:112-1107(+)